VDRSVSVRAALQENKLKLEDRISRTLCGRRAYARNGLERKKKSGKRGVMRTLKGGECIKKTFKFRHYGQAGRENRRRINKAKKTKTPPKQTRRQRAFAAGYLASEQAVRPRGGGSELTGRERNELIQNKNKTERVTQKRVTRPSISSRMSQKTPRDL